MELHEYEKIEDDIYIVLHCHVQWLMFVVKVLKSALERNDEYKVYSQMADIFSKSGKQLEAENIFKILAKKFSKVKEVWVRWVNTYRS